MGRWSTNAATRAATAGYQSPIERVGCHSCRHSAFKHNSVSMICSKHAIPIHKMGLCLTHEGAKSEPSTDGGSGS